MGDWLGNQVPSSTDLSARMTIQGLYTYLLLLTLSLQIPYKVPLAGRLGCFCQSRVSVTMVADVRSHHKTLIADAIWRKVDSSIFAGVVIKLVYFTGVSLLSIERFHVYSYPLYVAYWITFSYWKWRFSPIIAKLEMDESIIAVPRIKLTFCFIEDGHNDDGWLFALTFCFIEDRQRWWLIAGHDFLFHSWGTQWWWLIAWPDFLFHWGQTQWWCLIAGPDLLFNWGRTQWWWLIAAPEFLFY